MTATGVAPARLEASDRWVQLRNGGSHRMFPASSFIRLQSDGCAPVLEPRRNQRTAREPLAFLIEDYSLSAHRVRAFVQCKTRKRAIEMPGPISSGGTAS